MKNQPSTIPEKFIGWQSFHCNSCWTWLFLSKVYRNLFNSFLKMPFKTLAHFFITYERSLRGSLNLLVYRTLDYGFACTTKY